MGCGLWSVVYTPGQIINGDFYKLGEKLAGCTHEQLIYRMQGNGVHIRENMVLVCWRVHWTNKNHMHSLQAKMPPSNCHSLQLGRNTQAWNIKLWRASVCNEVSDRTLVSLRDTQHVKNLSYRA